MEDRAYFKATAVVMQLNEKLEELEYLKQKILFLYKKLENLTSTQEE